MDKYYEFCGYLNTPDEMAGKFFDDFPEVDEDGRPEKRISYYDSPSGEYHSNNWHFYSLEEFDEKSNTAKSIWRFYPSLVRVKVLKTDMRKPRIITTCVYSWERKRIKKFTTADGKVICERA